MSDFARFKIFDVLIVVSFILSSIAMILVFFDGDGVKNADNSINKLELNQAVVNQDKSQEGGDVPVDLKIRNDIDSEFNKVITDEDQIVAVDYEDVTAAKGDMKNLIKDLEGMYKKDSGVKSKDDSSDVKKKANENSTKDSQKTIHQIVLKSFIDKDDAMLELNRIRLQHRDITSGIETSVKSYKQDGRQLFGVFGKINGDISVAEKYCEKFESRGVKCVIA
jgi:DNA-binding TFAR19-related protein (PDSD5 family)